VRIRPEIAGETGFELYSGNISIRRGLGIRDSDLKVGFGGGAYLIVGWEFDLSFNISEFGRQMGVVKGNE
jgi:hypothetical protein